MQPDSLAVLIHALVALGAVLGPISLAVIPAVIYGMRSEA